MKGYRFKVGALVMCNFGPQGWKLGEVIALAYREDHWPAGEVAPYQVILEADRELIYVPEDDDRYCREANDVDLRVARRLDALAHLPIGSDLAESELDLNALNITSAALSCEGSSDLYSPVYRSGMCRCCHCCPHNWSHVELYSEHYRCAARNHLKVTRRSVDLGVVRVGDTLNQPARESYLSREGFLQCPTLARLPPGLKFSDDGALSGEIQFDPHRGSTYRVDFVAVSTAHWRDESIGIIRLEISFVVQKNTPPETFDVDAFTQECDQARERANQALHDLCVAWDMWDQGVIDNRETCERMYTELERLRSTLERSPRLDGGVWWVQLGGFHMNVHKLLENTLFECELYLGHALTFGDAEVRRMAELNLQGCYQKRVLESARFMWIDGVEQMMRGAWAEAAETLSRAAAQHDGWGWAVNYGDIWISESAARLIHGATLATRGEAEEGERGAWIGEVEMLLEKSLVRARESGVFPHEGHPWTREISEALNRYRRLLNSGDETSGWLEAFKERTKYWCALVLGGAEPFPPKPRPRLNDADSLAQRLSALYTRG